MGESNDPFLPEEANKSKINNTSDSQGRANSKLLPGQS